MFTNGEAHKRHFIHILCLSLFTDTEKVRKSIYSLLLGSIVVWNCSRIVARELLQAPKNLCLALNATTMLITGYSVEGL